MILLPLDHLPRIDQRSLVKSKIHLQPHLVFFRDDASHRRFVSLTRVQLYFDVVTDLELVWLLLDWHGRTLRLSHSIRKVY